MFDIQLQFVVLLPILLLTYCQALSVFRTCRRQPLTWKKCEHIVASFAVAVCRWNLLIPSHSTHLSTQMKQYTSAIQ